MENGETAYYVVNVPRGLTFVLPPTEKGSLHVPVVRHVPFWSETPSGVRDGGESS